MHKLSFSCCALGTLIREMAPWVFECTHFWNTLTIHWKLTHAFLKMETFAKVWDIPLLFQAVDVFPLLLSPIIFFQGNLSGFSLSLHIYIYIYKQCMGDNSYSTLVLEPYNIIIHYWIDRYIIDKHWLILHRNDIPLFGKNNCFSSKTFIGEISSYMSCTPLCINSY